MLSFLLGVLKVIGIVLLVLLIMILVIASVVLFVPIHYQGRGEWNTEKKEAQLQCTWLMKIVRFQLDYFFPEKPVISLKVLGLDIMKLMDKPGKKSGKSSSKSGESGNGSDDEQNIGADKEDGKPLKKIAPVQSQEAEALQGVEEAKQISDNTASTDNMREESTEDTISDNGVLEENGDGLFEEKLTLRNKIEKIIFKIKTIYDKIRDILYNIQYYIELLQEQDTQLLLANAKEALLKIWRSIRPKEFLLTGVIGFDTPDTTGKVYGYYCMAMPWIGEYVKLEPVFEEKRLEGEVNFKGRITIFVILVNGLRILFDKRLKPLIKKLKRGGKQNGR